MHNYQSVISLCEELERDGISAWLCGGWAKELHKIIEPRVHSDIDFLYQGNDFSLLEAWAIGRSLPEILGKRFPHKRAYEWNGIMVEFTLVTNTATKFFGAYEFQWPSGTFQEGLTLQNNLVRVVSIDALIQYQNHHKELSYSRAVSEGLIKPT